MSKELQFTNQPKKGPEDVVYTPPHLTPKVQSKVQPKVYSRIQPKISNTVLSDKKSVSSGSEQLPEEVQAKMENSFEQDFSSVKIHKDSPSASDINAKAYAQGNNVHFAPGEYDPSSKNGQELIGHELTHVVQQRQGKVGVGEVHNKGAAIQQDNALEKEADEMGKLASEGKSIQVSGRGSGIQKKEGDDPVTYLTYTVKEGDILVNIVKAKFPHMEFDMELVMNKVREIANENGIEQDKIYPGNVLRIPVTAQEASYDKHMPAKLQHADEEETAVKEWSEKSGYPVQVIRGDRVKESEYKNQKHEGAQYFILHSDKKEGLQFNEAISHNSKGDDGYFNKEEIAKGDYSKVPSVTVNGCESDENIDGFLKGGTPMAFGYFYKIEDELASRLGPQMLEQSSLSTKEQMHQFTRKKMLEMKDSGKIPVMYWGGLIDKYKEYSQERYGVAEDYLQGKPDTEWTDEKAKVVRKESRKNAHIKADRSEIAKIDRQIRALQTRISKEKNIEELVRTIEKLDAEKKTLQKQMLLQSQLKGEAGEKKTASVQKVLNPQEAVVEIKQIGTDKDSQYIALITTKLDSTPKVIYLPNTGKGVEKHLNHQANLVKFNMGTNDGYEKNYTITWQRIQAYLDSKDIKKIFYKASGGYNKININTLFHNGKYLLEFLDVQYLY